MRITETTKREKKKGLARGAFLFLFTFQVSSFSLVFGDVHYVSVSNASPVAPYTNWATAATVIQDAIDQAESNDTVLVGDGVYSNGGVTNYPIGSLLTNRISITKPILVQSLNGASMTVIKGQGPVGDGAVRCAYVCSNAVLAGFTLTNGTTRSSGDLAKEQSGGGAWCETGGVVSNCVISHNLAIDCGGGTYGGTVQNSTILGNSAYYNGGGAYHGTIQNCTISGNSALAYGGGGYQGTIQNCTISGNSAFQGGGVFHAVIQNCLLTGNSALDGGGACQSTIQNCTICGNSAVELGGGSFNSHIFNSIVFYNSANDAANWYNDTFSNSCASPLPPGGGNTTNIPGLLGVSSPHIVSNSPCVNAGDNAFAAGSTDIDGEPRICGQNVDMGCDEFCALGITGALSVAMGAELTNAVRNTPLSFTAAIEGRASRFEWDFGDGQYERDCTVVTHVWGATGTYPVVLRAWNNMGSDSCTTVIGIVVACTNYVWLGGTHVAPYTNWVTAATNIQAAIDAIPSGGMTLVTNGVYDTGGVAIYGSMTNRIAINKAITVQSVEGPGVTWIVGKGVGNGGTNCGDGAIRCAYVIQGALLSGFTLTNGHTRLDGDWLREGCGGGVWCETGSAISNCMIRGNLAYYHGGGAYHGTIQNCTISGNSAGSVGGGVCQGSLQNCVIWGNSATAWGGGSFEGSMQNCTISGNWADIGGGTRGAVIRDCIVYFNTATSDGSNWCDLSSSDFSCTTPLPSGTGNITDDPQFVDTNTANYRLLPTSPCIDKGINDAWTLVATDLDGNRRIINGNVDMGAYEMPFYASPRVWLQGAYDTNQNRMTTALSNNIPLTAPYKADARGISSIPSNVTDWVLVQIRETNGNSIVSRSAFVNKDGYVLADNGSTGLVVDVSPGTNCYLVLQHRNHLAVMSAQPLSFTNILTTYDFTTNWTAYYGGSNGAVQLKPGVWGMIAGDADGDGKITETDRKIVEQQKGRSGYLPGDLNLDGVVE